MAAEELTRKLFEAQLTLRNNALLQIEDFMVPLQTIEMLLAQVEQTPPQPLQDTLSLVMNVLLSKNISSNENMDIKASAVFSLNELLRIFAPDAPFSDDQMKEVFLVTIPVLDQLSLAEGRSFDKAVLVLDVMSKIRTVLILLDLEFECGDALVVQMFRQFFKNIRSDHPKSVFPSMESVMTLVLEDIDAISPDLLSVLLSSVKKENQVTSPMALKLGENVFTVCAKKLQKHIVEAVRKGTINVDDYAEIVKTIYQKESNGAELNSNKDEPKQNPENNEPAQDSGQVKEISNDAEKKEASESLQADGPTCGLLVPEAIEPVSLDEDKSKDEPIFVPQKSPEKRSSPSIEEEGNLKRARSIPIDQEILETKTEDGSRRITVTIRPPEKDDNDGLGPRGLKRSSSPKIAEQGSSKRANTRVVHSGSKSGNEPSSLIDTWTSSRPRTLAQRKPLEKSKVVFLLFGRDLDESKGQPRRCRNKSNVSRSSQEVEVNEKTPRTPSGRGTGGKRNKEVVAVVPKDTFKVDSDVISEEKDAVANSLGLRRSTRKRQDSNKKILSTEWRAKSLNRNVSSKPIPKRTLVTEKEEESESADLAEGLVGKKIKVWWPIDKVYYEGAVSSYDVAKKKHVVSYTDGDLELLNLKREKWQLIESDLESVEGESTDLVKLKDSSPIIGLLKNDKRKRLIQKKQAEKEKFESPSKRKAKSVRKNNAKTDSSSSSSEQSDEEKQIKTDSSPERVEMTENETSPERTVMTESEFGTEECANKLIALSEGVVENKKPGPISKPEKK